MMYKYTVYCTLGDGDEPYDSRGIVYGADFEDAMVNLSNHFGVDNIYHVELILVEDSENCVCELDSDDHLIQED